MIHVESSPQCFGVLTFSCWNSSAVRNLLCVCVCVCCFFLLIFLGGIWTWIHEIYYIILYTYMKYTDWSLHIKNIQVTKQEAFCWILYGSSNVPWWYWVQVVESWRSLTKGQTSSIRAIKVKPPCFYLIYLNTLYIYILMYTYYFRPFFKQHSF